MGLLNYLYPQGWEGGLLGWGNAVTDQAAIDKKQREVARTQGQGAALTMPGVLDSPMAMALGTSNVGKPIRAYHGSPHDFDKFDMSKIGTGEGAQAYGHGLYFAENEGVARAYKEALNPQPLDLRQMAGPYAGLPDAEALRLLDNAKRQAEFRGDKRGVRDYRDITDWIHAGRPDNFVPGRMYEVNLHADPSRFLDWDKPLYQQTPEVQNVLGGLGVKTEPSGQWSVSQTPSGKFSVRNVWGEHAGTFATKEAAEARANAGTESHNMGGAQLAYQRLGGNPIYNSLDSGAASKAMSEAGIPGIKYLDQGSRKVWVEARDDGKYVVRGDFGPGKSAEVFSNAKDAHAFADSNTSRNYVVFDPKIIEIIRKYGLAGLGLTGLLDTTDNGQTQ